MKYNLIFLLLIIANNLFAQKGDWVHSNSFKYLYFTSLSVADSLNAMATADGDGGTIIKTEDGGKSWKIVFKGTVQISNGFSNRVRSISYPTKNFAIAQFDNFNLAKTTDGGNSWSVNKFTNMTAPSSIFGWQGLISMVDEKYGYLSTAYTGPDRIFKTENGGNSWKDLICNFPTDWVNCSIENMICLSKNKIVCIATSNKLIKYGVVSSIDGGLNWTLNSDSLFDSTITLQEFSFIDEQNGFLVGYKSDSIKKTKFPLLYKTKDGGINWEEVKRDKRLLLLRGGISRISFKDTLNGIISGTGEILNTTDGGHTWNSEYSTLNDGGDSYFVSRIKGNLGIAIATDVTTLYYQPRITEVKAEKKKEELILYPNPTSTSVKVRLQPGEEELTIRDVLGKEIKSYKGIGTITGTEEYEIDVTEIKGRNIFHNNKIKGRNKSGED
ncbi:MAG: hypothetical protein IPP65_04940 [Chlorobi bacterium]|nr:hypothetical protein [Chlorobiota bacterium]